MSKMKNLVIPLVMIFINMIIMAMVMESAYYIQGFQYGEIWIYAILPITTVLGLIGMLKERKHLVQTGLLLCHPSQYLYPLLSGEDH